jgi:uncharacterized protein (TIGR02594 family)
MTEPIWLSVMRLLEGLREIPGKDSNPIILNWVKLIGAPSWFDNDDKAYCALGANAVFFVCHMPMARHVDPKKRDGYDLLRAKTFEDHGTALTEPTLGCIMTFSRPQGDHVAFYLGESRDAYYVYGANQSNTIKASWILKERCTSMRWPPGVPLVPTGRIMLNMSGQAVSVNEE